MRSNQDIARIGPIRHKRFQCGSLQVSGQEQSPAGGLHRQHDTRLVVGNPSRRLSARITVSARVQHPHTTRGVERKCVVGRHRANRNPGLAGHEQHLPDGGRVAAQKGMRHHDLSDRKSIDQCWHGIEVVGIGVGDDERVDVADPLVPQHTRHGPLGRSRRAKAAGVIDQAMATGAANQHTAAMPQRCSNHPQAHWPRRCQAIEQHARDSDDRPTTRHNAPCERSPQSIPRDPQHGQPMAGVPARHPPPRRSGHPGIGRGQLGRHFGDGRQAGQCAVAHPAACAGDGV